MKAFANAYFGRLAAYSGATDEPTLAEALAKNVWRGRAADGHDRVLARYVASARAHLAESDVAGGYLDFGPFRPKECDMSQALPFSSTYNLNRLGQAGDEVRFAAGEAEREALARFADVLEVRCLRPP